MQQNHDDDLRELRELRGEIDTLLATNTIKANEETHLLRDLVELMLVLLDPTEEGDVRPDALRRVDDVLGIVEEDLKSEYAWRSMPPRYYVLDGQGNPVPTNDYEAVARLRRNIKARRVAESRLTSRGVEIWVSTVFISHNMAMPEERPVLWETMVFASGCSIDGYRDRYHSRAEAKQGHRAIVRSALHYLQCQHRLQRSRRRMAVAQRRIAAGQSVLRKVAR